jgi:hexokinase
MSIAKATRPRGRISKPSIPQPTPSLHRRPMLEFFQNVFASLETMLLVPSVFRTVSLARKNHIRDVVRPTIRPLEDLAQEVNQLFTSPLNLQKMLAMSELMRVQFREKLQTSPICMLPSFNHTLPTGEERGTYLALDVGGSTFRVALVELSGEGPEEEKMRIQRMVSTQISDDVKRLPGTKFFDWMAEKIGEMLGDGETYVQGDTPLTTGLAWSFPIEQTSMGSGKVQGTGKGFVCFDTVQGEDLNGLIQEACKRRVRP